jgi:MFS family permease
MRDSSRRSPTRRTAVSTHNWSRHGNALASPLSPVCRRQSAGRSFRPAGQHGRGLAGFFSLRFRYRCDFGCDRCPAQPFFPVRQRARIHRVQRAPRHDRRRAVGRPAERTMGPAQNSGPARGSVCLGCALSPSWSLLLLARFVGGLAVGGASVVSPMYIAEIAPALVFLLATPAIPESPR